MFQTINVTDSVPAKFSMMTCESERVNPFDNDSNDFSDITDVYNNVTGISETTTEAGPQDFVNSIQEDFFDDFMVHINANSSVAELEDAIFKCKHMFLASASASTAKRQRLLTRLINLRRYLYNIKEEICNGTISPAEHQGLRPNLSNRLRRSNSVSSSPLLTVPSEPRSISPHPARAAGHDFKSVLTAVRYLGQLCESCGMAIHNPSKRVLVCSQCQIVCHPDQCLRGLTRYCVALYVCTDSLQSQRLNSQRRRRLPKRGYSPEPRSVCDSNSSIVCEEEEERTHTASEFYGKLEVSRLVHISTNLTDQCWMCFECRHPLEPAPNRFVNAEHSLLSNFMVRASSIFESGTTALSKQASMPGLSLGKSFVSPQLFSQVPSLSDNIGQLFQSTATVTAKSGTDSDVPHLQWTYSSDRADFGPIQTWGDACVLGSINRISCSRTIRPMTGESSPSVVAELDQAKLCYYTGKFFCRKCHWGDVHVIPACVFVLGDQKPKPVCRSAFLWLRFCCRSSYLFRVPESWYRHEPTARRVYALRLRLFRLQPYINAGCDEICALLCSGSKNREPYWLFDQPYMFSLELVSSTLNGQLAEQLTSYLHQADEHVTACSVCNRHVSNQCVVCGEGPIRSYQYGCATCSSCNGVCHRSCLEKFYPSDEELVRMAGISNPAELDDDWREVLCSTMGAQCRACVSKRASGS